MVNSIKIFLLIFITILLIVVFTFIGAAPHLYFFLKLLGAMS